MAITAVFRKALTFTHLKPHPEVQNEHIHGIFCPQNDLMGLNIATLWGKTPCS